MVNLMVKKEELLFDSRDEITKLYACKWVPLSNRPELIVQLIHDAGKQLQDYEEVAVFLAKNNILVVGNDHLGHGRSATPESSGYFCAQDPATVLVRDVHRLKKTIEKEYPGVPIIMLGFGLGELILRNYLLRYATGIEGAILVSPTDYGKICDLAAIVKSKIAGVIKGQHAKSISVLEKSDSQSHKKEELKRIYNEALFLELSVNAHLAIVELVKRYKEADLEALIPKKLPILIISSEEDLTGNRGVMIRNLYDDLLEAGLTKVQKKVYHTLQHDVLQGEQGEALLSDLQNWISFHMS